MANFDTLCLHAGFNPQEHNHSGNIPIYQTSSFAFENADQATDIFALNNTDNYEYTRGSNPTQTVLEKRLTALHNGQAAVAFSSGVGAIAATCNLLAQNGDNIISSHKLYGGTVHQFKNVFPRHGIKTRFFDLLKPQTILPQIDSRTKAIFIETISNPELAVPDIIKIAQIANPQKIPLVVDNTFATAYHCKPLDLGANIVISSISKYIGGQAIGIGGIVIDKGNFPWEEKSEKYPLITQKNPGFNNINFLEKFKKNAFSLALRLEGIKSYGAALSPFNAFLFIQGLQTLPLRMQRHSHNAHELAIFLQKLPSVEEVNYPTLPGTKYYDNAQKTLINGGSGMLSFILKKGLPAVKKFLNRVKIASHQPNCGDSRTLVLSPSLTIHSRLNPQELKAAGVSSGLIRASIGLEDIEDLKKDFEQSLS